MSDPTLVPSTIYPTLTYDDATSAIEWLCRVFGFTERLVIPGPDGTIRHSELSLGPGVIMVNSARPDSGRLSPRSLPGVNQGICVQIEDLDTHYAQAKAAGAVILDELKDTEYGSRGYAVEDPEGHQWYFGTYRPGAYWEGGADNESPKQSSVT